MKFNNLNSNFKQVSSSNNGTQDNPNRRLFTLVAVVFAVILLIAFIVSLSGGKGFKLSSVSPKDGSSVNASTAQIKFTFNQSLKVGGEDSVSFDIEPKLDFIFLYEKDSITLKLSDLPFVDQSSYSVTLKDVFSESGDRIETLSSNLTIELDPELKSLFDRLPLTENGYSIFVNDKNEIVVEGDFDKDLPKAEKVLTETGVTSEKFIINYINKDAIEIAD